MEGMSSSGGLDIGISCFTEPHFGTGGQKHTHKQLTMDDDNGSQIDAAAAAAAASERRASNEDQSSVLAISSGKQRVGEASLSGR
jgi:hypothetical protein